MIDEAAYIKLNNRVAELEETLKKLKGNLTTLPASGLTLLAPAQVAGAGGRANFDFQNISANYSRLIFYLYVRGDTAATNANILLKINNDGSAIYDYMRHVIVHTNALTTVPGAAATSIEIASMVAANGPASAFDQAMIVIENYANTNAHKVMLSEFSIKTGTTTTSFYRGQSEGWYRSTNAISRVTLTPSAGNFAQYSVARLYGEL